MSGLSLTSMVVFVRNTRPHRIAGTFVLIATIYIVYVSVHQNETEHVAHHGLVSKSKLSLKLLEEKKRDSYTDEIDYLLEGFNVGTNKGKKPSDDDDSSQPENSNRLWVESQVTDEIHWLDNFTIHRRSPVVPIKCNAGVKTSEVLKRERIKFLPNYKNPCWLEPINVPIDQLYVNNGFRYYSSVYKKVFKNLRGVLNSQKSEFPTRIRCLPYFFISGQPKCGSTDLYRKLIKHPHITTPPTKEPHWWGKNRYGWCLNYSRPIPLDEYVDLYDYASINIQSIIEDSTEDGPDFHPVITGDASVSTLWSNDDWWSNPENCGLTEPLYTNAHYVHHVLPGAKIIVILRNPTDRLYSDYLYFCVQKSTTDFHKVVENGLNRLNDCFETMGIRSCVYNSSVSYRARIRIGLYYVFLQEWMSIFPKDQILVIRLEDYSLKPLETMKKVHRFLGLKELSEKEHEEVMNQPKSNTRRKGDQRLGSMLPETRALLDNFYRPFNIKLARLLNDPGYLWEN